jgi:DNA helicase-2/ATP-dependent DNA helicase PcrA
VIQFELLDVSVLYCAHWFNAQEIEMAKLDFNATRVTPAAPGADPIETQARDTGRVWSPYQTNIFTFVESGAGTAVVEAVAGSGKTTTIVEALKRVRGSSIFLAFNKSIATELGKRGVNARTFHSLTYSPVMRHKRANEVTNDKLRRICDAKLTGDDGALYGAFITRLVGLGRQAGIGCLVPDVEQSWLDLVQYHDLELESEYADLGRALELASLLLQESNSSGMVDFDDMLYIAVKDGLSLPKFDFVFVDEAQDTNAIQRALLRKIMHKDSRMVAVGDPAQAIYGFRGADSNSLQLIVDEFNCTRLPLTISYRCPQAVVKYAQQWVSHIEAAPNAPEGEVQSLGTKWDTKVFQPGDLVVCRTTAPIIALAYKMLRTRVPVQVLGREIGQGLKALINKLNARGIEQVQSKLEAWRTREVEKAVAKKQDAKAEAINDKADAIVCLIEGLEETNRTVPALLRVIDDLFADKGAATVLSTIHKAKGLEAPRVFWLNSSQCPATWAKQDWQRQQEVNLCYVAVTRAQQTLVLIEGEKKGRG